MATPKKEKPTKTKPSHKEPAPKAASKGAAKAPVAAPAAAGKRPVEKPSKKSALRDSILARKAAMKPIAFSLDEVRAIAKTVAAKAESTAKTTKVAAKPSAALQAAAFDKPVKPNHFKAASLAEILGFNPKKTKAVEAIEARDVPEKFKRFHKLLMDMRAHLTEGIERHSEETLKRSAKEDAGDLSAYGQHMADAGTDTFDRDFALSLVSSEQEALSEIDAAIKRIRDGTYGVCEITGKPIAKDRLLAVPFTRYSAEAQKQIERNRHHSRTQAGLFGEGEEGGKIMEEDGGDGE
jgi:RNA polymerase-binding transcription factor DksA